MMPWSALGDLVLSNLIDKAVTANLDIVEVDAKLREARAQSGMTRARALPSGLFSGSAQQAQASLNGQFPANRIPFFDRNFSLYDASFDASWEIELWGGQRRSVQAADRKIDAARARAIDTRLQIVAEVVRTYPVLRATLRGDLTRLTRWPSGKCPCW